MNAAGNGPPGGRAPVLVLAVGNPSRGDDALGPLLAERLYAAAFPGVEVITKTKLFIDTFVSFSYLPLRLISLVGILLACLGFLYAFFIVFNRLFFSVPVEGWASLMVALLVVSGTQLIFLGILGEYLWRNFDETRKRPAFIIDIMIGFTEEKKPIS